MTVKIAPSLMCANLGNLEADIRSLESVGADYLHFDIMDGRFVPNLAMCPDMMSAVRELTSLPLDIHLMVEKPEHFLEMFEICEGDVVSVHQESTVQLQRTLNVIRDLGARSSVAINPATPVCMIEEVIGNVELVLVMTVNPGFAGQGSVPSTLSKIARVRQLLDSRGYGNVEIEVDGNVSFDNAQEMLKAGASVFVGGTSSVFSKHLNIVDAMERLRSLLTA